MKKLFFVFTFLLLKLAASQAATRIDLSGEWLVRLDAEDQGVAAGWTDEVGGVPVQLPGITSEAGLGNPIELEPELTKEVFLYLRQRLSYIGAAWFSREFEVPDSWQGGEAVLEFERVIWQTRVWVNGEEAGVDRSLATPHRFEIGSLLRKGTNRVVVEVDNREIYAIGDMGHAYTNHTQTIWNGLIGGLSLELRSPFEITDLNTRSERSRNGSWAVKVGLQNATGKAVKGSLRVEAKLVNGVGKSLPPVTKEVALQAGSNEVILELEAADAALWSEFNPALFEVSAVFTGGGSSASKTEVSGLRSVETDGRKILVNGRPTFFRGTLECSIAPRTGYPATTVEGWLSIFQAAKDYGLNHIRFHSWCPPEAAFSAADQLGVYLQVELPNWTFRNGQDEKVDGFLRSEGDRIFEEYGHHPSFVLFSLGNELDGDFGYMDGLLKTWKEKHPEILFTSTTYSFSPRGLEPGPQDDYFVTQRSKSGWVRGQGFLNSTWPSTDSDYAEGMESVAIPLITHEVGQYNVFPNLAEIPKYDGGNLRPLNFEAIQLDLQKKGRLDEAADYTLNSGKLAVLLYKEDVERALRTEELSGIQLLDLHDFPGQSTATIGILDAFWESKGLVTPERFREFCGPIVPLIRMPKLVWSTDESVTAAIEVANFSAGALKGEVAKWSVRSRGGEILGEGSLSPTDIAIGNGHRLGAFSFDLSGVEKASELEVVVELKNSGAMNRWSIWVYPVEASRDAGDVVVIRKYGPELTRALADGRKVLFFPRMEEILTPHSGRFVPVFWSPLHFPDQAGSLGAMIEADHALFEDFPTDTHTNWQWWELLADSYSVNADALGPEFDPMVRFVDKYNRNSLCAALFEANVGAGKLLVCTLDVETDLEKRIVARRLGNALLDYAESDSFRPSFTLAPRQLDQLFRLRPYQISLEEGTSRGSSPIENAMDGDPATLWEGDPVEGSEPMKLVLLIDFTDTYPVQGLEITPRQKGDWGRIVDYEVEALQADGRWHSVARGSLEKSSEAQVIAFGSVVEVTALRLRVVSETWGRRSGSVAEVSPIFPPNTRGVESLGIIEGFND